MPRPSFTIRFQRSRNHARLRRVSTLTGVSMNAIVENAIERELDLLSADLVSQLEETVRQLQSWTYTDEALAVDIESFGQAEILHDDPIRARMIEPDDVDRAVDIWGIFEDPSHTTS